MMDVLLVCMPFGPVFCPSIGLGLLHAGLTRRSISSRVRYFTIDFAERIGQAFYWSIASEGGPPVEYLAGEWIFSAALTDRRRDAEAYVQEILQNRFGAFGDDRPCSPAFVRRILEARRRVPAFLERCLEEVLLEQPKIVGFSCVFQQHVASLALARAIKRARPDICIVFGGASCEGVMGAETLRQFAFVDAVVSGEGDIIFPELAARVLAREPFGDLPGVRTRATVDEEFRSGRFANAPLVENLDDLPYPDHQDFFAQYQASRYEGDWQPSVPFETSRGCWWGQRSHCTFCGLNGGSLRFRSKSAARAIGELAALVERYPNCDVEVVDNILDVNYLSGFLPALAARRLNAALFYETKSNLKKSHIRILRDAGVRRIQPGVESLSDRVLALMRKGVTALQNVQMLKWCKELGVKADWNFLWGFPGEPPEEYARMAALVPLLTHLPPPTAATAIRLDRFSPNFSDPDAAGIVDVEPMPSYPHVYDLPREAIANIAYYFAFRYRDTRDVDAYVARLSTQIARWQKAATRSDLFAVDVAGRLVIWDLRPAFDIPIIVLDGIDRLLYLACDAVCDLRHLVDVTGTEGASPGVDEIRARLDSLVARGLALGEGSRYLALAIPLGEYSPAADVVHEVYRHARLIGQRRAGAWLIPLDRVDTRSWRVSVLRRVPRNGSRRPSPRCRERLTPAQFSITQSGELAIR